MSFVKCAWKDTWYCYHFSTFGPISMDFSLACKVFSSWRKQTFLDVVAGAVCWSTALPPAQETVLHVKFWLSIFSPSASWLHKQECSERVGVQRESEGGLAVEFRLPVKYLDTLYFPDLPLHNAGALCQCAVRWGVQAPVASAEYLY